MYTCTEISLWNLRLRWCHSRFRNSLIHRFQSAWVWCKLDTKPLKREWSQLLWQWCTAEAITSHKTVSLSLLIISVHVTSVRSLSSHEQWWLQSDCSLHCTIEKNVVCLSHCSATVNAKWAQCKRKPHKLSPTQFKSALYWRETSTQKNIYMNIEWAT